MRPAREGRENPQFLDKRLMHAGASMRPAREGRENELIKALKKVGGECFNEARP